MSTHRSKQKDECNVNQGNGRKGMKPARIELRKIT